MGRIHGYDEHLPATLPRASGQGGRLTREQALRRRAEDVMRDLGFDAVVNLSLADPGLPGRLRLRRGRTARAPIRVSNPLSVEQSELRTTLLGSLLDAARYNVARGAERVALFESGRVYLASGKSKAGGALGGEFAGERKPPAFEPHCIAALALGPLAAPSWGGGRATGRLLRAQGRARGAGRLSSGQGSRSSRGRSPSCIPGRAARVLLGGVEAGWLGEIHPLVCREWDLDPAVGFQVGLAELVAGSSFGREQYEDVTTYPAVHEDLAIVVDEEVPAAKVREAVVCGRRRAAAQRDGLRPLSRRAGG